MQNHLSAICLLLVAGCISGCTDYLELKPDAKMAIPNTVEDCDLLLSDFGTFNSQYPYMGELSADNYFLQGNDWANIYEVDDRNAYIWSAIPSSVSNQWQMPYKAVFTANLVIEILDRVGASQDMDWRRCMGAALFYRAFAFHQLLDVFTVAYDPQSAEQALGIPLRLNSDLEKKVPRATLGQSYAQVIADYNRAISLLPTGSQPTGRPDKCAAYAGMARLRLSMQDYAAARAYADSALAIKSDLLLFEDIDGDDDYPFRPFNREVIFHASSSYTSVLSEGYAKVDPVLYASYANGDLRRTLFFQHDGGIVFRGSYNGSPVGIFVGLTTAEILLVRAEAAVWTGDLAGGQSDINRLLSSRWREGSFVPIDIPDRDVLLALIRTERRKELVFRGQRWPDLKRLNLYPEYAKTITRTVQGTTYTLEPNSDKYALLLPLAAIQVGGLIQNERK